MTTLDDHIKQWRHNRLFLGTISPKYSDWIVTASFYTALHAIDALLTYDKVPVVSHDARNSVLQKTNRYQQLNRHYKPLYNLSRTVRYLADPNQWVPYDSISSRILIGYLYPIEASVQKLTGRHLDLQPIQLAPLPSVL